MTDGKHRGIEVDRQAALLGVDKGLARGKTQLCTELRGADLLTGCISRGISTCGNGIAPVGPGGTITAVRHGDEVQTTSSLVLLEFHGERGTEAPVLLAFEGDRLAVVEHHLIYLAPLKGGKHIILIGVHELIGWRHDIVGR